MTRPQYLDIPYPSGNGASPLPPEPTGPAASASASPVADFVQEVLTGKYTPPPDPARVAFVDRPALETPRSPPPVERKAIPPFKMADENPANPAKPALPNSTEALLQAIDKVYRVARDRIAFHEREAKKLRAALAPFGAIQSPGGVEPGQSSTAEEFIRSVIHAAGQLPEQTS